ncbi:ImmA/IrrE family metallo-endopeptidase [Aliarcobacter lanthieri]|uniref:ImmA/IrrE family metallo-endopeptidase n=1 Tax=Aliarcobacter lanthieri TaxID=1355374 RepID=UPI003AB0C758
MRNTERYRSQSIKLLNQYGLYKIPVEIDVLAEKLNIKVNYENLGNDISGKISYNPKLFDNDTDDVVISINNSENELRQRFSLAHEIAHYIYDIDFSDNRVEIKDSNIFLRSEIVNPIEIRANKYAEKLLMPKKLFEEELLKIAKNLFPELPTNKLGTERIYEIVKKLSKNFQVSIPAVIMRLYSLKRISSLTKSNLFEFHKK